MEWLAISGVFFLGYMAPEFLAPRNAHVPIQMNIMSGVSCAMIAAYFVFRAAGKC